MRTLVHTDNYQRQCEQLGGYARMDQVHTGIEWAICSRPEVYAIIDGTKDIRLLKTISGLGVWFRIIDDEQVELLHIEKLQDDSLEP